MRCSVFRRIGTRQSGAALLAALVATLLLVSLSAFAAARARVSLLVHQRTREASETFYAADAGLAAALADFAYEPVYDRLEGDGAAYPFSTPLAALPFPPGVSFDVVCRNAGVEQIEIRSTAAGRAGGRRVLIAIVQRTKNPYIPATLFSKSAAFSLRTSPGFRAAGAGNGRSARAALGVANANLARSFDSRADLDLRGEKRVRAIGHADLETLARRALGNPGAVTLAGDLPVAVGNAAYAAPSSLVTGSAAASGLLVVDGDLTIDGDLSFEGIVVVLGDVRSAPGSSLRVRGALLQGNPGRAIDLRGNASITYDANAIRAAAPLLPAGWGKHAEILGWREM